MKPSHCSVNVVLMTIRSSNVATEIISSVVHVLSMFTGLRLTIAYGGDDLSHREWLLDQQRKIASAGGDLVLIFLVDPVDRFDKSISPDKSWTIFISDDDPPSTNFLRALVNRTTTAPAETTLVAPTFYLGVGGESVFCRKTREISDASAPDRLMTLFSVADQIGSLYYSAHLTSVLLEWKSFIRSRSMLPSYVDQLLVCWSAARGPFVVTDEPTVMLRDDSNWVGLEACTNTDARIYPVRRLALFHELFWTADMISLMFRHEQRVELLATLHQWMLESLSRLVSIFDQRAAILNETTDAKALELLHGVVDIVRWLHAVTTTAEFIGGIHRIVELATEAERALRLPTTNVSTSG